MNPGKIKTKFSRLGESVRSDYWDFLTCKPFGQKQETSSRKATNQTSSVPWSLNY